jgi:hypothetical protein
MAGLCVCVCVCVCFFLLLKSVNRFKQNFKPEFSLKVFGQI